MDLAIRLQATVNDHKVKLQAATAKGEKDKNHWLNRYRKEENHNNKVKGMLYNLTKSDLQDGCKGRDDSGVQIQKFFTSEGWGVCTYKFKQDLSDAWSGPPGARTFH